MRRALLAVIAASFVLPQAAHADTNQLPGLAPAKARTIVVDAKRGRDGNPGTARRPLRTVAAAWERIAPSRALKRAVRIVVRPGRYGAKALPNYWESRLGTREGPDRHRRRAQGTVTFGSVNLFDLRWVAFDGITFADRNDLFHCERCQHVLLTRSRLTGSPDLLQENIKINQSQHIGITDSVISGAGDNAIDFVAVQYARITGNVIERRERLVRLREGRLGVRARRAQPDPPVRHRRLHRRAGHRAAVHDRALHPLRGLRHRRPRQHDLQHRGRRDRRQRRLQRRRRPQPPVERRARARTGSRSATARAPATGGRATRAASAASSSSTPAAGAPRASTTAPTTCASRTGTSGCSGNVVDNPQAQGDQLFSIAGPSSKGRTGRLRAGERARRRRPERSPAT